MVAQEVGRQKVLGKRKRGQMQESVKDFESYIGSRIRERLILERRNKQLSQEEVAKVLAVSQRTYSSYELGYTRISVERLKRLAQFYNVSMDYLAGCSDERGRYPAN